MSNNQDRRAALKNIMAGSAAIAAAPLLSSFSSKTKKENNLKGNINHSVCQWTYGFLSVEELCKVAKDIGITAIDLMGPKDWPTLQKSGLYSSMCYVAAGSNLTSGFADKNNHAKLTQDYLETFPLMVKAGYKDVICFSGNRNGMDDYTGLDNCVTGLQKILPEAEKNGITVHMELLNSKIDHKDYMCDTTPWGVELCKRLNSNNFKLLYDIYHIPNL